jgi:hypothetical protein
MRVIIMRPPGECWTFLDSIVVHDSLRVTILP